VLDTNLKGIFFTAQAVARAWSTAAPGRSSTSPRSSQRRLSPRRRLRGLQGRDHQLTRVMALEWAPYGICVNAIAPAYIRTEMTADWLEDRGGTS